jgi:hypothetical protein
MSGVVFETTGKLLAATTCLGYDVRIIIKDRDAVVAKKVQELPPGDMKCFRCASGRDPTKLVESH